MSFSQVFLPILSVVFLLPIKGENKVSIESLAERYFEHRDFKRLLEYFTGREYLGNQLILRSDPSVRAGMYFILNLDVSLNELPKETRFILNIHCTDSLEMKIFEFVIPSEVNNKKEVLLGITGDDWASKETKIVAWRIEIRSDERQLLSERQSFLWAHEK